MTIDGNYFSTDAKQNPLMYNWNVVYLRYCDGNSFTGSNSTATKIYNVELHWRGKHILDGIIDDCINNRGMNAATDIILGGCSAGALSAILNCDRVGNNIG